MLNPDNRRFDPNRSPSPGEGNDLFLGLADLPRQTPSNFGTPLRVARPPHQHPAFSGTIEMKASLSDAAAEVAYRLVTFDQRHRSTFTNAQLVSPFARMDPDDEMQVALRRKASFLLISEGLESIHMFTASEQHGRYRPVIPDHLRTL